MKPVLDTSVIVEYVIKRSPYREKIKKLFEKKTYDQVIYITPITLSETLYVVSRIYSYAGIHNPNREALNYVFWILSRAKPVEINRKTVLNTGELKRSYTYFSRTAMLSLLPKPLALNWFSRSTRNK